MSCTSMLLYYLGTLYLLTLAQALFFTDSTENDYPRMGKRGQPLPKYFYKKWLGLQSNANNNDFGSTEDYPIPGPLDRMFNDNKQIDIDETDSRSTPEEIERRRSLIKKLWLYLTLETENF